MIEVPAATPVTAPVEEPIVATAGVAEVQVPPFIVELSVEDPLEQIAVVPEIVPAEGAGVRVNTMLSVNVEDPLTVTVNVTVPAAISDVLGLYVAVLVVPLTNVPVPEVVQAIVPFIELPEVV